MWSDVKESLQELVADREDEIHQNCTIIVAFCRYIHSIQYSYAIANTCGTHTIVYKKSGVSGRFPGGVPPCRPPPKLGPRVAGHVAGNAYTITPNNELFIIEVQAFRLNVPNETSFTRQTSGDCGVP
jgi:hypothetical protein